MKRLIPLTLLVGCAHTASVAPVAMDQGACEAEKAQAFVGQTATQALAVDAMKASGAKVVRWLRPGMAVTMDFRPDRLNIALTEANRVDRITCG